MGNSMNSFVHCKCRMQEKNAYQIGSCYQSLLIKLLSWPSKCCHNVCINISNVNACRFVGVRVDSEPRKTC